MPKLGFVQVEVSTRCQLSCLMCPKSCFSDEWIAKDMNMETFRLIPFKKFHYAHLQGWGEPLLNPNIGEMVDIAAKSCKVGLTTNGLLIDHHIDSILKLDLLAVSVASGDARQHERVRGCSLEKLAGNIKLVSESRGKRPKVVIATMMLKSTIESLPKLIDFAAECGADEVIANNLDYIPSKELVGEEVFGLTADKDVEKAVEQAGKRAEELGIGFIAKPRLMEEALVCAENPVENCVVAVDGRIAPCAYLNLPTASETIPRWFRGRTVEVPKVYFSSFKEWLKSDFRDTFKRRLQVLHQSLPTELPPLPQPCRTCYKAYSV